MELYQVSRYENIAERIKRLSSPTSIVASDVQNGREKRLSPRCTDISKRNKYTQDVIYSKYPTLDTIKGAEEQANYSPIHNLYSPRSIKTLHAIEPKLAYQPVTFHKTQAQEREEVLPICTKQGQKQNKKQESKIGRVRSDGNVKIQEILQSFNNYKQNKQKFLSNLGKQINSIHADHISEVEQLQSYNNSPKKNLKPAQAKGSLFSEIDNIWNEKQEPTAPKFQRSTKRSGNFDYIADIISPAVAEPTQRPKNYSKSKLILKNTTFSTEDTENSQFTAIKTVLSPRGPRVPGKICRNNDRTFTNYAR